MSSLQSAATGNIKQAVQPSGVVAKTTWFCNGRCPRKERRKKNTVFWVFFYCLCSLGAMRVDGVWSIGCGQSKLHQQVSTCISKVIKKNKSKQKTGQFDS